MPKITTAPATSAPATSGPSLDLSTMGTPPAATVVTDATLVGAVSVAGFTMAKSRAAAVEALRKAGFEPGQTCPKMVRDAFVVGYVAYRLFPAEKCTAGALKNAAAILRRPNHAAKTVADGVAKRTAAEEAAYSAARVAFASITKVAKVGATDNRGGARVKKVTKVAAPVSADVAAAREAAPKLAKPTDLREFFSTECKLMAATISNSPRATHPALVEWLKNAMVTLQAITIE